MSVDFYPAVVLEDGVVRPLRRCACGPAEDGTCRACTTRLNLHHGRAVDVLAATGLMLPYGALPAAEVAAKCRAYLSALAPQPARPGHKRGRVVVGDRPAGDTRDTVARLLEVAEDALAAGEGASGGWVAWS